MIAAPKFFLARAILDLAFRVPPLVVVKAEVFRVALPFMDGLIVVPSDSVREVDFPVCDRVPKVAIDAFGSVPHTLA